MREIFFKGFLVAVSVLVIGASTISGAAVCDSENSTIATDKGPVTGVFNEKAGVCAFKGVPFAAPPVGDLRFAMPAPHAPWQEPLDASTYGEQCTQNPMSLIPSTKLTGSEDCLYLNVWTPAGTSPDAPRHVLFFIHGGGFIYGSGAQDMYEGERLSGMKNVVVVTANYRLGPFGFLVHPSLKDSEGRVGNYGMYDQIEALKWVKENIKNFGGDPNNVTIFGESAGGMSVGALLVSPPAKGLFQKAVIESGPVIILNTTEEKASVDGARAATALGCTDEANIASCLRGLSSEEIMKGTPSSIGFISRYEMEGSFQFLPVAKTEFLPELPLVLFNKGLFDKSIPVIMGTNRDEASYFTASIKIDTEQEFDEVFSDYSKVIKKNFGIDPLTEELKSFYPLDTYETPKKAFNDVFCDIAFTCPTRMLANVITENGGTVYLYHFIKPPQEEGMMKEWGAFHGAELPFIFGNFTFMGIKFNSSGNRVIASKVMSLWSNFAENGVPSATDQPAWPVYEKTTAPYMEIGDELTAKSGFKQDRCVYLESQISKILEQQ